MATSMLKAFSQELEELVARTASAVVGVEHRRGQGSGVVLASDGYVLTNSHVVQGPGAIRIRTSEGESVAARVVGIDSRTDLAVVRAETGKTPSLPFASAGDVKVGQVVIAIGNPLRFERSVSLGVVSAIDRSLPGPDGGLEGLIQTDAAINPGNSGGPLIDVEGRVVGINTAIIPYAQGIGFAIPSYTATWVAAVLMQRGEVRRPFIGISALSEMLPSTMAEAVGQRRGVRVHRVGTETPAEHAGLRAGDIVVEANGQSVGNVDDLQRTMVLSRAREIRLGVWRKGRRESVVVKPEREPLAA